MTVREREEERLRPGSRYVDDSVKFAVRTFRCLYCRTIVDGPSQLGHLGRCTEIAKQKVTFARGMPVFEHFEERMNGGTEMPAPPATETNGVDKKTEHPSQQVLERRASMDKRAWAAHWLKNRSADERPSVAKLLVAVRRQFGSGIGKAAASELVRAARGGAPAVAKPKARAQPKVARTAGPYQVDLSPPPPPPLAIAQALDLLSHLRKCGVTNFTLAGVAYVVP